MRDFFKKKFATRVRVYASDVFVVEYAHFRFFPTWHYIVKWNEYGLTRGLEGWVEEIFLKRKHAEEVAQKINSIEDVEEYYKKDNAKEEDFYKRQKKYLDSINTETTIYKK